MNDASREIAVPVSIQADVSGSGLVTYTVVCEDGSVFVRTPVISRDWDELPPIPHSRHWRRLQIESE